MTRRVLWAVLAILVSAAATSAQTPLRVGEDVIKRIETPHPYPSAERAGVERVWSQTIEYPGATYIAVHFEKFSLGTGDFMVVRSPGGEQKWSYTGLGRGAQGLSPDGFWATHIKGDRAIVELFSDAAGTDFGFVIDRYARGYRKEELEAQGLASPESICGVKDYLEAKCYQVSEPLIYDKSRAVARLLSGGSAFCTGWLVGSAGHLMTNNHCISTASAALNTDYEFMAEGPNCATACGPDQCPGTIVDGGTLVQTNATLDYSLILLTSNPTASYGSLRLRTTGGVLDERIYIPGHPAGQGKKISVASTHPEDASGLCELGSLTEPPCSGGAFQDYGYMCDTEGGSSGSPVLAYSDHKVVSLHHCGGCRNTGLDITDIIADLNAAGNLPPGATFDPVGTLELDAAAYGCSDAAGLEVLDDNLVGTGTVAVTVMSTTEPGGETVTLVETPAASGRFSGSLSTTPLAPTGGDGLLSVAQGDTITATYIDADDGAGGSNIPRVDTASVDCVAPVISNVQIVDIQGSSARVTWQTNEASDSTAHYGLAAAPPPGQSAANPVASTQHSVLLLGLLPCTDYIVRVASTDGQGNSASDDNGGLYYTFDSGLAVNPTYASTDPPLTIPTASATPTVARIQVPDNKSVLDVNVRVSLTHSYDGDIVLSLRHPDGTVVTLSNRRGGGGDNYTATVFDDEAATPIASGVPPFSGSFIPDGPLAALDGKSALGEWRFEVLDNVVNDGGSIESVEIILSYPAQSCGPDVDVAGGTLLADACAAGGSGHLNGFWDDGEAATFRVDLENSGTATLTGVSGTITALTAGVTVEDGSASYPDIQPSAVAGSEAPHFVARLPVGFPCGQPIQFQMSISADQGVFSEAFTFGTAGQLIPGSGTALFEDFAAGIPATWTVVDGGVGGGAASTWMTTNPAGRFGAAPIAAPFALVDSDNAGASASQDEELISPVLNLSSATNVVLEFDQYFKVFSASRPEKGDVDVRSSLTLGAWVNVYRSQNVDSPNPDHRLLNITALAAGAPDVQIRFHYWDAAYEWYWLVDNVRVTYTAAPSCSIVSCSAAPPAEVPSLWWSQRDILEWTSAAAATSYNVYQGSDIDLPKLLTAEADSCLRGTSAALSMTGLVATPPVDSFTWWLVRGSNGYGEGPSGSGTLGARVQEPSGLCP